MERQSGFQVLVYLVETCDFNAPFLNDQLLKEATQDSNIKMLVGKICLSIHFGDRRHALKKGELETRKMKNAPTGGAAPTVWDLMPT